MEIKKSQMYFLVFSQNQMPRGYAHVNPTPDWKIVMQQCHGHAGSAG